MSAALGCHCSCHRVVVMAPALLGCAQLVGTLPGSAPLAAFIQMTHVMPCHRPAALHLLCTCCPGPEAHMPHENMLQHRRSHTALLAAPPASQHITHTNSPACTHRTCRLSHLKQGLPAQDPCKTPSLATPRARHDRTLAAACSTQAAKNGPKSAMRHDPMSGWVVNMGKG